MLFARELEALQIEKHLSSSEASKVHAVVLNTKLPPAQAHRLLITSNWDVELAQANFRRALSQRGGSIISPTAISQHRRTTDERSDRRVTDDRRTTDDRRMESESRRMESESRRMESESRRMESESTRMESRRMESRRMEAESLRSTDSRAVDRAAFTLWSQLRNTVNVGVRPFRYYLRPSLSVFVGQCHKLRSTGMHCVEVQVDGKPGLRSGWQDGGNDPRFCVTFEFDNFDPIRSWLRFIVWERHKIRDDKAVGDCIFSLKDLTSINSRLPPDFPVEVESYRGVRRLEYRDWTNAKISIEVLLTKFKPDHKSPESVSVGTQTADEETYCRVGSEASYTSNESIPQKSNSDILDPAKINWDTYKVVAEFYPPEEPAESGNFWNEVAPTYVAPVGAPPPQVFIVASPSPPPQTSSPPSQQFVAQVTSPPYQGHASQALSSQPPSVLNLPSPQLPQILATPPPPPQGLAAPLPQVVAATTPPPPQGLAAPLPQVVAAPPPPPQGLAAPLPQVVAAPPPPPQGLTALSPPQVLAAPPPPPQVLAALSPPQVVAAAPPPPPQVLAALSPPQVVAAAPPPPPVMTAPPQPQVLAAPPPPQVPAAPQPPQVPAAPQPPPVMTAPPSQAPPPHPLVASPPPVFPSDTSPQVDWAESNMQDAWGDPSTIFKSPDDFWDNEPMMQTADFGNEFDNFTDSVWSLPPPEVTKSEAPIPQPSVAEIAQPVVPGVVQPEAVQPEAALPEVGQPEVDQPESDTLKFWDEPKWPDDMGSTKLLDWADSPSNDEWMNDFMPAV